MSEKNEVAVQSSTVLVPTSGSGRMFFDVQKFEFAQRVAHVFSKSTMVPEQFRNNIGNCIIALNYAERTGVDPFMAMQKMYVIHGRPAVETQFAVAMLNSSGRFDPLEYDMDEVKTKCTAFAKDKKSGKIIRGPEVSLEMAKAEGWSSKPGSKWKTMPEVMLMYRSAIFFIRQHAPEVLLGMMSKDEVTDIEPTPWHDKPADNKESDLNEIIDVQTGEVNPTPINSVYDIPMPEGTPVEKKEEKARKKTTRKKKPAVQPDPAEAVDLDTWKQRVAECDTVLKCNQWLMDNREAVKEALPEKHHAAFFNFVEEHIDFCKATQKKEIEETLKREA